MLSAKNCINITGGVCADPEVINDNILKLRLAVDFAGNDRSTTGSSSGYFDVTYFMNNEDNGRNAKFVRSQIADGKMKKGSQISIVGRLTQDRWPGEGDKSGGQKVYIVAEAIDYAGGSRPANESSANTGSEGSLSLPDF